MRRLIQFFSSEHTIGNLITFFIIVLGVYSITNIRRDIFPPVDYDISTIRTILPGASPEQGEKLVLNTIEEKLKEVDGIDEVRSATTESQVLVTVKLDADARDVNKTNADIQNAIDRIDNFPEDAEKPIITSLESGLLPVIEATISGPFNEFEIRKFTKDIADELSLLEGVSSVNKRGYNKREFLIHVDQKKMKRRQVSIAQIVNSIRMQNISAPAGKMTLENGNDQLIRTEGQFENAEDILNTQISANLDGYGPKIKHIATVTEQLEEPSRIYKYNGKPSILLQITKKVNADALDLVTSVKEKAAEFIKNNNSEIKVNFSKDMSVHLKTRLKALSGNLLIGLILVIFVLTLFLPWQVTLVVSIGVPVALLATLAMAYLLGWSINLISLIGLIIVLGMLVDDAIVVSENIWSEFEQTGDKAASVVNGVMNVIGPVTASILTTVSSFAPMLFMSGIFGAFVFHIPSMVILALVFSMIEVFLILPSHFSNWVGIKKTKIKKKHWFDPCTQLYKKYVSWSLRFRYLMMVTGILLFSATIFLVYKSGKFKLFPSEGSDIFFVKIEGPPSISLDSMSKKVKPLEKIISQAAKDEVLDYVTTIGIFQKEPNDPQTKYGNQFATIQVNLPAKLPLGRTVFDIMNELESKLKSQTPEGFKKIGLELPGQGPPTGRDVSVDITGSDFSVLKEITTQIQLELEKEGLVKNISSSFIPGKDEWQIKPKLKAMASAGITTAQLSQDVRVGVDGLIASSIRTLDEEINIRVKMKKDSKNTNDVLAEIKKLKIGNRRNGLTPISRISNIEKTNSLSMITHLNFKRSINVSADSIDPEDSRKPLITIKEKVDKLLKKYPGYTYSFGGMDKDTNESMKSLLIAFIAAFIFIFSLLIITFRSFLQPVLILTTIPLGFVGAVIAMLVHGRAFSFMSLLGTVALAGVIVNNSIVLTDFVNKCRNLGFNLSQSIVEAAGKRLRPIVLTTITTVSGLLPTAYGEYLENFFGIGGYDPFIVPIALALGWGLFIGSILTLIFFPCFIRILDDLRYTFVKDKQAFHK